MPELAEIIRELTPEALRLYKTQLPQKLKEMTPQDRTSVLSRLRGVPGLEDIVGPSPVPPVLPQARPIPTPQPAPTPSAGSLWRGGAQPAQPIRRLGEMVRAREAGAQPFAPKPPSELLRQPSELTELPKRLIAPVWQPEPSPTEEQPFTVGLPKAVERPLQPFFRSPVGQLPGQVMGLPFKVPWLGERLGQTLAEIESKSPRLVEAALWTPIMAPTGLGTAVAGGLQALRYPVRTAVQRAAPRVAAGARRLATEEAGFAALGPGEMAKPMRVGQIDTKAIRVLPEKYQYRAGGEKGLDLKHVQQIVDEFNPDYFEPIQVRQVGQEYELLSGHHRLAAWEALQKRGNVPGKIPAIIHDVDEATARELARVANLGIKQYSPVEKIRVFSDAVKAEEASGKSSEEALASIAARYGAVKPREVQNFLDAAGLPGNILEWLDNPATSPVFKIEHAAVLARAAKKYNYDPVGLPAVIRKLVLEEGMTPGQLERALRTVGEKSQQAGMFAGQMFDFSQRGGILKDLADMGRVSASIEGERRTITQFANLVKERQKVGAAIPETFSKAAKDAQGEISRLKARLTEIQQGLGKKMAMGPEVAIREGVPVEYENLIASLFGKNRDDFLIVKETGPLGPSWVVRLKGSAPDDFLYRGTGSKQEAEAALDRLLARIKEKPATTEMLPGIRQVAGQPEAGVQAGFTAEGLPTSKIVRPTGRGEITQISMEDQLKLARARGEVPAAAKPPAAPVMKYGVDVSKVSEAEYISAGMKHWEAEAKGLGMPLNKAFQRKTLTEEYRTLGKAVAPAPEVAKPVPPAVAKEPWQMTKEEWAGYMEKSYREGKVAPNRPNVIKQALSEGKPVPAEVLADYPDLAKAIPKAEAAIPEIAETWVSPATGLEVNILKKRGIAAAKPTMPPVKPVEAVAPAKAPIPTPPMAEAVKPPGAPLPIKPPAPTGIPPVGAPPPTPVITPEGKLWLPEPPRTTPQYMAFAQKELSTFGISPFRGKAGALQVVEQAHQLVLKARDVGENTVPYVLSYIRRTGDIVKEFGLTKEGLATTVGNPENRSLAINDVLSNYAHYTLNPKQLELAKKSGEVYQEALKLAKSYGVKITELGGPDDLWQYIARRVKGKKNPITGEFEMPPPVIGGFRMGAKISAQKERQFEQMLEGVDLGFLYENPDQVMANHIRGIYRLIGNKQAEDLVKPLTRAITKEAPLRFGERAIAEPALQARAVNVEIANAIDRIFAPEKRVKAMGVLADISGAAVGQVAALDGSVHFIQGLPLLGVDIRNAVVGKPSTQWLKGWAQWGKSIWNPESINSFRGNNPQLYKEAIEAGIMTGQSEFVMGVPLVGRALGKIPKAGKTLQEAYKQLWGRAGQAYSDVLEYHKVKLFGMMKEKWLKEGGNVFELGAMINRMAGGVSTKARGVPIIQRDAERIVAFAPNYFRASLLLLKDMASGGMKAREVASTLASLLGAGAAVYYVEEKVRGREPKLRPWPKRLGGDGAEAYTTEIAGQRVGIGTWVYGMLKLLAEVGAMAVDEPDALITWNDRGPLARFVKSKQGPLIGIQQTLATGRTYFGQKLEGPTDYLTEVLKGVFIPIMGQSLVEKKELGLPKSAEEVATTLGAEFLGLRTFPYSLKSRWTDEGAFASYEALPKTDLELREARTKNPQILSREQYRRFNPEVDAKLFITGQVGALLTPGAEQAAVRLVQENKIDPDTIRAVKAIKERQEQEKKLGLPLRMPTPTDVFVKRVTPNLEEERQKALVAIEDAIWAKYSPYWRAVVEEAKKAEEGTEKEKATAKEYMERHPELMAVRKEIAEAKSRLRR